MKLYLDSTDNKKVIIRLDRKEFIKEYAFPRDQDILFFLDSLLVEQKKSLDDLTEIEVNPGPGSFTGSRIGVAIANALAFALKLKVNGQTPPIMPVYASPPNITHPLK